MEESQNNKDPKDNMIVNLAKFVKENWKEDRAAMVQTIIDKQTECRLAHIQKIEQQKLNFDKKI